MKMVDVTVAASVPIRSGRVYWYSQCPVGPETLTRTQQVLLASDDPLVRELKRECRPSRRPSRPQ